MLLDTVVFECFIFSDKAKAYLFQHILTPGVFSDGICVYRSHSQLVKGSFYRQTSCLRPVSLSLHRVVLHMDTQGTFRLIALFNSIMWL